MSVIAIHETPQLGNDINKSAGFVESTIKFGELKMENSTRKPIIPLLLN
jgi:hypothetical protein